MSAVRRTKTNACNDVLIEDVGRLIAAHLVALVILSSTLIILRRLGGSDFSDLG